ncbi:MAG: PLP-dependent aminotransferase family protein [Chitinispirillaceae bacterium]
MRSSEIRRLMALAADPSIISFSGGMPAASLLPTAVIDDIYDALSLEVKQAALQYGPTAGYPPLLASLTEYLRTKGLPFDGQSLIITTGAQQAINLLSKVMLDPGDMVVTENPSFIGALAAFLSYGASMGAAPLDDGGIVIADLKKVLDAKGARVKMVYLNPSFQNPAGIIYREERRREVLEVLAGRDLCLLEDDPYGELYFDERDRQLTIPLKTLAGAKAPVCYVGSFAKIFGPGLRLGWLLGPREIVEKCELAKQSMDACSSTFTQVLAHEYLRSGRLPRYLSTVRAAYARRATIMLDALKAEMPSPVTWTTPKGGFYVWVTMPESIDASQVFAKAIKGGAAFVIGSAFDPYGERNNCFRMAFSHTPEEKITEGVQIIASAVRSFQ